MVEYDGLGHVPGLYLHCRCAVLRMCSQRRKEYQRERKRRKLREQESEAAKEEVVVLLTFAAIVPQIAG